jgi:predicted DNA repair protein MutK
MMSARVACSGSDFDDVAALARLAAASVDDIGAAAGRATAKAAGVWSTTRQ